MIARDVEVAVKCVGAIRSCGEGRVRRILESLVNEHVLELPVVLAVWRVVFGGWLKTVSARTGEERHVEGGAPTGDDLLAALCLVTLSYCGEDRVSRNLRQLVDRKAIEPQDSQRVLRDVFGARGVAGGEENSPTPVTGGRS